MTWVHTYGASWLGAIGFTMSPFIASLAFRNTESLAQAKPSILVAFVIAGLGGYLILRVAGRHAQS